MLELKDFEAAYNKVQEVVLPTKLIKSDYFSDQTGNDVYLKPENMQLTGAYKIRGAYYKISTLSEEEKAKGLITASAGNHAQGVALAAAISIIGGADGPTSIFLAGKLHQTGLMGPIAVAAYSYMSLVPIIQPPIMKLLTTEEERKIKMEQLRPVSKTEKILFPIIITIVVCLILPTTAPLVGMLML